RIGGVGGEGVEAGGDRGGAGGAALDRGAEAGVGDAGDGGRVEVCVGRVDHDLQAVDARGGEEGVDGVADDGSAGQGQVLFGQGGAEALAASGCYYERCCPHSWSLRIDRRHIRRVGWGSQLGGRFRVRKRRNLRVRRFGRQAAE